MAAATSHENTPLSAAKQLYLKNVLSRSSAFDHKLPSQPGEPTWRLRRSSSHGLLRKRPQLQLPSFEKLGISAHQASLSDFDQQDRRNGARPMSANPEKQRALQASHSSLHMAVPFVDSALLTPPEDIDSIKWNSAFNAGTERAGSSKALPVVDDESLGLGISVAATNGQTSNNEVQTTQGFGNNEIPAFSGAAEQTHGADLGKALESFLDLGIGANISSVTTPDARTNGITVISQTLPHPIHDSHPSSAFTPLIQAIQSRFDKTEGQRAPYVRITHAVPPQFSLRNLPSSPPGTPSKQGEDDYFSLSVFANAAPVPTYHLLDGSVDRSAPSSPAPIVPPSSVQVALVERYIPPSTTAEYECFFSENGPSVLLDRLFELSPSGGSLMLVYPTRKGGQTFRADHVGPLLDSFLRNMVVVNDMSSDLASSLGRMPSINHMLEFQQLKERVARLCKHLSRPKSSASRESEYSLVYADVGGLALDRTTWSEWFLQQEIPRMKAALKSYWQRGQKLPTLKDTVIPATLIRDINQCIETGTYEDGEPTSKIEVGVFVIKRTR